MKRRKVLYISLTVLISVVSILLGFLVFSVLQARLPSADMDRRTKAFDRGDGVGQFE